MKPGLFLLIVGLVLLAGSSMAGQVVLYGADLPYQPNDYDSITFAESTNVDGVIHLDAGAFPWTVEEIDGFGDETYSQILKIDGDLHVYVDIDTFLILFDTSGSSSVDNSQAGITIEASAVVHIRAEEGKGEIKQARGDAAYCYVIAGTNPELWTLDSLKLTSTAHNSECLQVKPMTEGPVVANGGDWRNESTSYNTRYEYDNGCANLSTGSGYTLDTLVWFDGVSFYSPHIGLSLGQMGFYIVNCTFTVDAINDSATWANNYGLLVVGCAPGLCSLSTFLSGTDRYGGRGIMVENCRGYISGSDTFWVTITDLTLDNWSGNDGENADGTVFGVRVRSVEDDMPYYWKLVKVKNIDAEIVCDGDAGTDHIGKEGTAVKITWSELTGDSSGGHFVCHDVDAWARALTETDQRVIAFEFGMGNDLDQYGYDVPDTIYNINAYSSGFCLGFSDQENQVGDSGRVIYNAHLSYLPGGDSGIALSYQATIFTIAWQVAPSNKFDSKDNWLIDATYANGASAASNAYATNHDYNHFSAYTLHVPVIGGAAGNSIWIVNGYGDTVYQDVLLDGDTAYFDALLTTRKDSAQFSDSYIDHDSLYNYFTIGATSGADSTADTITVLWNNKSLELTLTEQAIPNYPTITGTTKPITGATIR